QYHQLIRKLLKDDVFQGLRVDHIDGLYDPEGYLQQLRQLAGPQTYIVVEKILERGEELVANWPIQGTSGYDFLAQINNLFTNRSAEKDFNRFYGSLTGNKASHEEQIRSKKKMILERHMGGELQNLVHLLLQLETPIGEEQLRAALSNFLVYCPVYRYYQSTAHEAAGLIDQLAAQGGDLKEAYQALKKALQEDTHFFNRCMQLSGPLMAKGVEDTLMYNNFRFI